MKHFTVSIYDREQEVLIDMPELEAQPGDKIEVHSTSAHSLTLFFGHENMSMIPEANASSVSSVNPGDANLSLEIPHDAGEFTAEALHVVTDDDQWPKILIRRPRTTGTRLF